MATTEYPKTAATKLGRLAKRGTYDYATIHSILNTSPILHLSFVDPEHPFPVVLPMLGCTGNFKGNDGGDGGEGNDDLSTTAQDVYLHGYVSGRVFRSASAEGENGGEEEEGLPITIAASLMDGLVLALAPFHNSCNYRSAVVYGHAVRVTDPEERLYALRRITDSLLPGRWDASRSEPTPAELKSTSVLKVRIQSASAKVRAGGPSDDRKDLQDQALREGTWTGVVPVWLQWGEATEAKDNGCVSKEKEAEIERWRVKENSKAKEYAYEAIEKGD
ncbi:5-nitroimidazole antibiotic resistance protein [Periconia macrospinosa]|uniref:5-nitroimidazole antibiotic resistance protein n=1 Tax=Periconia macrospinosa TaxID=97972 RepID=A0A2V1DF62_9PLEO|nr:5-nitroimidazole antibiotic resistance protein [Periconia macrospinosa]